MTATPPEPPRIVVDLTDAAPTFEQIRRQIAAHVAAARLVPGDRLPTIRALASDLGLAPGTVARAYKELEADGTVVTRRRAGTVVAPSAASADVAVRRAATEFVATARAAGLTDADALAAVRGALLAGATGHGPSGATASHAPDDVPVT